MLARTVLRTGLKASCSRIAISALHTSQPLPPPTNPLVPSQSSASVTPLPPLLPASTPLPAPTTTPQTITLISQSPPTQRYITARLHSRTYLLHPSDILTLPNLPERPEPGTILNLTRILSVGNREHSIASPDRESLPSEVVRCSLTVLEHTKSPLTRTLLKKRRKGYERTIENKQGWTRFRVGDVFVGSE